jgi:hypothetical protein
MTKGFRCVDVDRDAAHQPDGRTPIEESSARLRAAFRSLTDNDPAYWDYSEIKYNQNPYAYFQYPAMMVPRMQGAILDTLIKEFPSIRRTIDPFAGSGTVLTESLKRGLNTVAIDINPMAILLCRVKAQGFDVAKAESLVDEIVSRAKKDRSESIEITYKNRFKWFTNKALITLSRYERSIRMVECEAMRRLFWVCFAEAVRSVCNSRTTTYKLHIRPEEEITARDEATAQRVEDAMRRVVGLYTKNFQELTKSNVLKNGSFRGRAIISWHDMRNKLVAPKADALISSPPYGDNHTTITYGQHSFLPLNWIPLTDIDSAIPDSVIANTHSIDSLSLGGLLEGSKVRRKIMEDKCASFKTLITSSDLPSDGIAKLSVFFYDLDNSLKNAIGLLRRNAPIVLTLGNRCVAGKKIQTDSIVRELLESHGCIFVDTHSRAIPTKRMAHRNKSADTMLTETLLVMRGPSE